MIFVIETLANEYICILQSEDSQSVRKMAWSGIVTVQGHRWEPLSERDKSTRERSLSCEHPGELRTGWSLS